MKTLIRIALAAVMLITTLTAHAGWVSGHYRSNGTYVAPYYHSDCGSVGHSCGSSSGYGNRDPYAAHPSAFLRGCYRRSNGTQVPPTARTSPHGLYP